MPTAPGLLRDQRWPHCSEQNSPIYVWYCIRAVNIEASVLGHISPHLKPLVSVVVDILGQSHLSRGLTLFLNSQAFSHRLLETNTQLSVTSMGTVPKWAAPSLAPRHRLCLPHAVPLSGVATGKSWLPSQSRYFKSCLFKEGIVAGWKSSTCFSSSNYGFERNRTRLLGCGCCSRKLRPSQMLRWQHVPPPAPEGSLEASNTQVAVQGSPACNKNFPRQSSLLALGPPLPPQRAQEKWGGGAFFENQEDQRPLFPKLGCFGEGLSLCNTHLLHHQQTWRVDNFFYEVWISYV